MSTKKVNEKDIIKNLIQQSAPTVQELNYQTEVGELKVKVFPVIRYADRVHMINDIVEGVFMGEKDTLENYTPEFLSLVKRHSTISYFTDLKLPKKLEDTWLLVKYTPIYDDVAKIIGDDLKEIFDTAEDIIKAYKKKIIAKSDILNIVKKVFDYGKDAMKNMPKIDMKDFDLAKLTASLKEKGVDLDLNGILGSVLKHQDTTDENKQ